MRTTKQRLRFSYDEPTGMSWDQEKGDVKSLSAAGRSPSSAPTGPSAVYELRVDPGRMLGMLLRGPVEGKVKEYLTKGAAEGLKRARRIRLSGPAPAGRSTPIASSSAAPTSRPTGCAHLDAIARWLQDAAFADGIDAGLGIESRHG